MNEQDYAYLGNLLEDLIVENMTVELRRSDNTDIKARKKIVKAASLNLIAAEMIGKGNLGRAQITLQHQSKDAKEFFLEMVEMATGRKLKENH